MRVCYVCVCVCVGLGSDDEVRLVHNLFLDKGYNPLIRPVRNLTNTVKVQFGMAMIQLINVVRIYPCILRRICNRSVVVIIYF